jgi:hypothetical protein
MPRRITGPQLVTLIIVAAGLALAGLVSFSRAQAPAPPPVRMQVTITQVKPEMMLIYEDLVKNNQIPSQKKIGIAWRRTYASGTGEQNIRVAVLPLPNYAELDKPPAALQAMGAEAYANYQSKIRGAIVSQRIEVQTLQPTESIFDNNGMPAPLIQVQALRTLPGKGAEFAASLREDYLPAYRKAGVTNYAVYTINQGNTGVLLVRGIPNYAELDKPPLLQRAGLTQDQQDKIAARRNATLASGIETTVYRLIPDMSYGSPPPLRSTN